MYVLMACFEESACERVEDWIIQEKGLAFFSIGIYLYFFNSRSRVVDENEVKKEINRASNKRFRWSIAHDNDIDLNDCIKVDSRNFNLKNYILLLLLCYSIHNFVYQYISYLIKQNLRIISAKVIFQCLLFKTSIKFYWYSVFWLLF